MRKLFRIFCLPDRAFAFLLLGALSISFRVYAAPNVIAWGAGKIINPSDGNDYGQSIVPGNLTNAVFASGGWSHSLAVNSNGTLRGWGDDSLNQTDFFPSNADYVTISCGYLHSLALRTNGTIAVAGGDFFGQIDVPSNLSNAVIVAVASGWYHSLALKSDGTVAAWGAGSNTNSSGTNPNYNQAVVPPGLSNVVAISGGGYHSLALISDGTVRAWGLNDNGQGQVPPGISNVIAIAAGGAHNMVLKADGTVVCWGLNTYGETNVPAGLSNVVAIAAGGWHNLALKSDGTVVAWGAGSGSNPNVDYHQNAVPAGLTNVVQIAAGLVHSLAITNSTGLGLNAAMVESARGSNSFTVSIPTRNGRVYQMEYKNSLDDASWSPVFPLRAGNGGLQQLIDTNAYSTTRFYRIRQW